MRSHCAQNCVNCLRSSVAVWHWALIGAISCVVLYGQNGARAQDGPPTGYPPVIQNFVAVNLGGGQWQVRGTVVDENPAGLTVYIGGVVTGGTVTQADGTFTYTFSLPPMTYGTVYAMVMDDEGLTGGAQTFIFNY